MQAGIIGGTGPAGRALAVRLGANGVSVLLGSRDRARGEEVAAEVIAEAGTFGLDIVGVDNATAAGAEVVVLATPWDGAVSTARDHAETLSGKVVVSMVNALARVGNEFQALVPARGSIAASVQAVLPGSRVTAAFQHLPARELGDLAHALDCDVLVCADDREAGEVTGRLVEAVPGLRAVQAGSLASANAVEALTAVLLNVNIRYKTHVAVKLPGLPER
ncbi:MAG TPA: NADPH-dependent F420 reductase [Acidimicrobiales bacterium]|nr:NADPH-dependent F420 reductase [Acidimicrobiales bacterium]